VTLNRATVKRRHFNGRQLTAATDNSATLNLATFNREHVDHPLFRDSFSSV